MKVRIGNGFDVHRLRDGKSIKLCGIEILHNKQLVGHSDADVAMHALTDSIFGAIAEGDIGVHFPPDDQKWKGANSEIFLKKAIALMEAHQYALVNIDLTIICEFPKIKNHTQAMRTNIASLCKIHLSQVSIKGTTTERLGFTGREEGIAVLATTLLEKNE